MVENKYYERKIRYLDLMENGERAGGAGFVKTEVKGMDINFAVTVKGLHPTDTYERDVMLQVGNGEFSVGRISLKEGQGQFIYHAVMDYSQLQGIRIPLGGTREICCRWQENKKIGDNAKSGVLGKQISKDPERNSKMQNTLVQNDETQHSEVQSASGRKKPALSSILAQLDNGERRKTKEIQEIQLIPWDEVRAAEESLEKTEKLLADTAERAGSAERARVIEGAKTAEKIRVAERAGATAGAGSAIEETAERDIGKIMPRAAERMSARERGSTAEQSTKAGRSRREGENAAQGSAPERRTEKPVRKSTAGNALRGEKTPVRLMEDKWQQIWAIYPHIHPFQDEREYLSISPADFVLLSGEAYRAANNSFLLHGYYNYDHLILTKIEKRGEVSYYIGVPGNYYEREKQVAVMFGFESFECGTEPAQAGDFGYYMMRTQL